MKKIIFVLLMSNLANAADFLIEVQPKTDSVGVQELKSELKPTCSTNQKMRYDGVQYVCEDITSSSILNFASDVISAMSSTLSNYLLKTDIPVCSGSQVLTRTLGGYSCISPSAGSSLAAVTTKNASYSATTSDEVILADLTTSSLTITLPTATGNTGKRFVVKIINNVTETSSLQLNLLTVNATSSQIDFESSVRMAAVNDFISVVSNGTKWLIESRLINSGITYVPVNTSNILTVGAGFANSGETIINPGLRVSDPLRQFDSNNVSFSPISKGHYSFTCSYKYFTSLGNTSGQSILAVVVSGSIRIFDSVGNEKFNFYDGRPAGNISSSNVTISAQNVPMEVGDYMRCYAGGTVPSGTTASLIFRNGNLTAERVR